MAKKKTKKNLIVVHSIKGGCGKTTISLALAQYFALPEQEMKICCIDTDLVGVGTNVLAGEGKIKKNCSFTDFVLLNPFDNRDFFKNDFADNPPELFSKFVYPPDKELNRHFHAVFSSVRKQITDRAIRATNDLFFAEDVKSKIEVLLEKLFAPGSSKGMDTIILDTTPGLQGITGIILELAKEIREQGLKNIAKDDLRVIFLVSSTNNFSHLRSLWEYIYGEKDIFLGSSDKTIPYLLVLNQIPLGMEFDKLPDPSVNIEKDLLKETTIDEKMLKEFSGCLNLTEMEKNTLENRMTGAEKNTLEDKIKDAFKLYYTVKEKNYLMSMFELYKPDIGKLPDADAMGAQSVVIPDHPPLRRIAANFGDIYHFNPKDYFYKLENEVRQGILKDLASRVSEIIAKAN
jgi:hypothetical protein